MNKIIVLFEVKPTKEGMDRYLELAKMLKPMLNGFKGFQSAERFRSISDDGKLLSMSVWDSEDDIKIWRNIAEHRLSQAEGKNKLFENYKITICSTIREYGLNDRENAPKDSNEFFDNYDKSVS